MLTSQLIIESIIWGTKLERHQMHLSRQNCDEYLERVKEHHSINRGEEGCCAQRVNLGCERQCHGWRLLPSPSRALLDMLLAAVGHLP